ncbi:MAG: UDP-N-acetylglucosamine 1-carboxyvinyltransferase [Candidatus Omnitrophica bacterium]|nr:UDP-N-acetylglucosamine 1-carboxyvinyltransferase [Candidatus Omnitrophota bacterium]
MDKFVVYKSILKGQVSASGSKNSSLPIMAATLLTDETCVIHNVPDLSDVRTMARILENLGKKIEFSGHTLRIHSRRQRNYVAPYRLVRTMRASFCVLGPLLAKRKKAKVSLPGGCVIGSRPVDLHIKGLIQLGAHLIIENGYCVGHTAAGLIGNHVFLGGHFGSSVLGTGNVLMAATLAKGETLIEYSACEPEIADLVSFLKKMGADIQGGGTQLIKVKGKKELHGAEHTVIPDRIEVGTLIAASLATRSPLTIKNVHPLHMTSVLECARRMGAQLRMKKNILTIRPPRKLRPVNITTLPFPGFPTDLQAQFMIPLCLADGVSLITEKIFPDRFMHVAELQRMGAKISRSGPYAIIEGTRSMYGAEVMASDLRASAALVIAGLVSQGKTEILRIYHLDRGYYKLEEKLRQLGARINREKQ